MERSNSATVLNGPYTRPALISSSALSSRESIIRRCSGVYSSFATTGGLAMMVMTPGMAFESDNTIILDSKGSLAYARGSVTERIYRAATVGER